MKNKPPSINSLFSSKQYFIFFCVVVFTVSSSVPLFFKGVQLPASLVAKRALFNFLYVLFLSLIFTLIDAFRRKYTIELPVRRILDATQSIAAGDFSTRILPLHKEKNRNEFDLIIENFNLMAHELSSIETLRTDFIADVSHELKTPLAAIQNYATILQDPTLSEEVRIAYAKEIHRSTQRLSSLITNILKINKLENQQILPDRKPYNLSEQLCECLLTFEDSIEKKALQIIADVGEDVMIVADEELLALAWNNLFSNAVKFTDSHGTLTVLLQEHRDSIIVSIADTGCGMSQDTLQRIFDKFYQGDSSHATQGNGLGLALTKRVVDMMQGHISVESTIGQGTTFTVTLQKNLPA